MSFNWVCHEIQLGPNYGLSVASPTDLVAEAKRIGEDAARSLLGNARSLLVHKEL
jgi:hypothetical protein